jgi:CTP-dependent riboflavin kinase
MSVKASFWAIEQWPGTPLQKLVLMVLADWADENGRAWPRISSVAHKATCSSRTVLRCLSELEADGFLSRTRTRRRDGRQGSNRYTLKLGKTQSDTVSVWPE